MEKVTGLVFEKMRMVALGSSDETLKRELSEPEGMSKHVYFALQTLSEDFDLQHAKGQDCTPNFDAIADEVARLQGASPWTMHPDHGCVLAASVPDLDRNAQAESTAARQ